MREILDWILVGAIESLAADLVFWLRRMFGAVYLLDQMTLRAGDTVQRRIAGPHLINEQLSVFGELPDLRRMAAETERLIFTSGRVEIGFKGHPKGRRMDGFRERRSFPLFKDPLMAALALVGMRKSLFYERLRFDVLR